MSEYLQKMIDYSNDVLSGEVIACQKHKWACMRFLSDLKRSEEDAEDFPYKFDDTYAVMFEEWCRIFKHTKGILAKKPIELMPITHFIMGNLLGWVHKETGYRRFKNSYWQVARKNVKTQIHALVALFFIFVVAGDEQPEVFAAATKKDQAKLTYDEAVTMLTRCKLLIEGTHYKIAYGRITSLLNDGYFRALSKEDNKSGDGLNPSLALIDEYHQAQSTGILDALADGMGSRPEPLISIITTAGADLHYPCFRVEYHLISQILDPSNPINIDTYFVMVNELDCNFTSETIEVDGKKIAPGDPIDDITDPKVWEKANPIRATYKVGIDDISAHLELALAAPDKMRSFMTKYMNVWVNQRAMGYMNMAKWSACGVSHDELMEGIKKNTDGYVYVGVDLSKRIDLTSASFEFYGSDEKYYVISHSFIPESMFHEKIKIDKVPYDLWEKQGYLTVTQGDVVDYRAVKKWILDFVEANEWKINEVCIDPHGAVQLSGDFIDDGVEVVEIRQGALTLSEPTKDVRYMTYSGRVVHGNDPVLTWAVGNAVTKVYHNESILLDKSQSTQRIDPIAALVNAHTRAMVQAESVSIYEKRGLLIL
jgi:phage terminase large subunit-like protein